MCDGVLSRNNNSTDSLFDGGTNRILVNSIDLLTNVHLCNDYLYLADNTAVPITAVGTYGIFNNVAVVPSLTLPLISTKILCYPPFNFIVIHMDDMGYIVDRTKDPTKEDCIVTTVSIRNDGLYHFDNLNDLVYYTGLSKGPRKFFTPLDDPQSEERQMTMSHILKDPEAVERRRHLKGVGQGQFAAREVGNTPMQQLHLKMNHMSEKLIKHTVKNNVVDGLQYTWDQIKRCRLELCEACLMGRMRRFPSPSSICPIVYLKHQSCSLDIIDWRIISSRGYRYSAILVERVTDKLFNYHMKDCTSASLIIVMKRHLKKNNHLKNIIIQDLKYLQSDGGSQIDSKEFLAFCVEEADIHLNLSAPFRQVQNRVERYIQTVKGGLKTTMAYNNAPLWYWDYGLDCWVKNYDDQCKMGRLISRNEDFTGVRSDVSEAVPFYALGYYQVSEPERIASDKGKVWGDKAVRCRYLGSGDYDNSDVSYKHSCEIIVVGQGNRPLKDPVMRRDCYFGTYQEHPSLLNIEPSQRHASTFICDPPIDYTPLVGDLSLVQPKQKNSEDPTESDKEVEDDSESDSEDAEDPSPPAYNRRYEGTYCDTSTKPHDEPPTQSLDDILKELEEVEIEINQPDRPRRTVRVDPKYKAFLESMRTTRRPANEKPPSLSTEYKTHYLTNKQVYVETPEIKTNLAKIKEHLKRFDQHVYIPPPILGHVPQAPKGSLNPKIHEALNGPDKIEWQISLATEKARLGIRHTWDGTPENPSTWTSDDPNEKPMKSMYNCRCSQKADGTWKYRVRHCACGYSQIYGRDYVETYAPTAKFKSFNILMNLAAINDWEIRSIDIENAFLESELEKPIMMNVPSNPAIEYSKPYRVKLLRALYGLKQAGERFYDKMYNILTTAGFTRTMHDICVFSKTDKTTGKTTHVLLYVDDILFTGSDTDGIRRAIDYIATQVENITDIGPLTRFVGVDITRNRDNHSIQLTQVPYIDKISDPTDTKKLNSTPLDASQDYRQKGDGSLNTQKEVGELRYAADHARPDILAAASLLGAHTTDAHPVHVTGAKRTKRYLKGSKLNGLQFGGSTNIIHLFGMCDGSYIPYGDSKSQMGYAVFMNLESGAIMARSHRDTTVSHSAFEIEIKALDELIRALVWVRGFLTELGFCQKDIPTPIYIDNEAAIKVGNTYQLSEKISHMVVRLNYIHQQVRNGTVVLKYIDTNNNVADTLTKALPHDSFLHHTERLLHGFRGKPIVAQLTKTQEKLMGLPVTLKRDKAVKRQRGDNDADVTTSVSLVVNNLHSQKKTVTFNPQVRVKSFFKDDIVY
jgi:hypothetical protein